MTTGLLHLHNLLRWVILILLLVCLFQAFAKKESIQKWSLFLMIAAHTMLLLGLYQWIAGRYGIVKGLPDTVPSLMKDKFYRFYWIEHPISMITAVVLISLARRKAKALQYSKVVGFLVAAIVLMAVAVPWPFRDQAIARGLFPGA
jgi:hypothetical protein